jgi:N6-adenosine-specific RNA methylase IME4
MGTKLTPRRSSAITEASISRTMEQVERAIATALEPDEVMKAYEMAAACKLLAKQVDASRSIQNKCAASHTKAVRKVGELTKRMRDDGVLAKRGGDKSKVTDSDNGQAKSPVMTLGDLGINRNIAAAGVKLLGLTPSQIDAKAAEATENGEDFSCRRFVSDIRRAEKERDREGRREKNREKVRAVPTVATLQSLDGVKFATIVIDPPWDWGDEGDQDQLGRARPDYSTMTIEELERLDVIGLADDDCHIYLWITNRSLPKGFRLLEAWGFRYITALTWVKPHFGMGNYFRGQTEHVLFGVKGSQPLKRKDVGTVFQADRGPAGHSSKPAEFLELVESCSPGPYIEMFSRSQRDGWVTWGEQTR